MSQSMAILFPLTIFCDDIIPVGPRRIAHYRTLI